MRAIPALGLLSGIALSSAGAMGQAAPPVEEQMQRMQEELDALRADNADMRTELSELQAVANDDWLTDARANEVRNLVADVLADSQMRSSLLDDGMTAGWSDGFFLASPDGKFKLEIGGQLQIRWAMNYKNEPDRYVSGWEVTRTNLRFKGHVFNRDIQYFIRTDITRDETGLVQGIGYLKDAWVRFNFRNDFSMRIGQFKSPFMREELVDSSRQLAAERSIMNENLSIERTQGIEFFFSADPTSTLAISLNDGGTDQIGGFNLAQSDPKNTDALANIAEWAVTGRWEKLIAGRWKQFADFTSPQGDEFGMLFGIAAHAQQNRRGVPSFFPNQRDWVAYTTDLSVEWGGANLFASWTHHYLEIPNLTVNVYGALVQGGVYLTPKWELFGRFEYAWYRFDNNGLDQLAVFTIGTNYYIEGHALKWTNDLGVSFNQIDAGFMRNSMITNYRQETSSSAGPQVVFRTQLQLLF